MVDTEAKSIDVGTRATTGKRGIGLRLKIAGLVVAGFVANFTVLGYLQISDQVERAAAESLASDIRLSTLIATEVSGAVRFRDAERVTQVTESILSDIDARAHLLAVVHADRTELARKLPPDASDQDLRSIADMVAKVGPTPGQTEERAMRKSADRVQTFTPITVPKGGESATVGTLLIEWDHGAENAQMRAAIIENLILSAGAALAVLVAIMLGIGWLVTLPVKRITAAMERVAAGDYDADMPHATRGDELGQMSRGLLQFRNALAQDERDRAARAKKDEERHARDEQKRRLFDRLGECLQRVTQGAMTERLDPGEFGDVDASSRLVCENYNQLIDTLSALLDTVSSTAETVRVNALEISQVATEQSQRSETQAATLEESAAALEELTESVRATAGNAAEADKRIQVNREQAEASGAVVQQTVEAMKRIEESSSQISAITSVIDDIAFQTNLLALNAGVEAARAGEAGRGFAVVASEVRALAQRASDSANEIKGLILRSGQHVDEGGRLVDQTGDALTEIIAGVAKVSELVSRIAQASQEQSCNLDEVHSGINALDKVTQRNAAVIEETSAASRSLSQEAETLTEALAGFRKLGAAAVSTDITSGDPESCSEPGPANAATGRADSRREARSPVRGRRTGGVRENMAKGPDDGASQVSDDWAGEFAEAPKAPLAVSNRAALAGGAQGLAVPEQETWDEF